MCQTHTNSNTSKDGKPVMAGGVKIPQPANVEHEANDADEGRQGRADSIKHGATESRGEEPDGTKGAVGYLYRLEGVRLAASCAEQIECLVHPGSQSYDHPHINTVRCQ